MQLFSRACFGVEPSPRWLVSNGEKTVGPVETDLLVRGVVSGRIPETCSVSMCGESWRPIDQVREVRQARSGMYGPQAPIPGSVRHAIRWLADANDVGEALSLALHGACTVTGAQVGILYRQRHPLELPVVSASLGDPMLELGEVVSRADPAWNAAAEGEPTLFRPGRSAAARAMALRLSPKRELAGIAMIPLRTPTEVVGVIELGRFDHCFRTTDARALVPLVTAALARVEELSWDGVGLR
jgi:hypothetical protein